MAMTRDTAPEPRTFVIAGHALPAKPLPAGLYLVATPIGNLGDISLRALETLAAANVIACEDTRVSHKLLERYGIKASLSPYHEHNAAEARPRLVERMQAGETVALISDAGTPLISDPGYKLVRAAQEEGIAVTAIPGASSVLAALNIAGLPTDRFFFEGFLPAKQQARRTRIGELARIPATLVLFEAGPRMADVLADLADVLGPREAAICRELTKLHEEMCRDALPVLATHYAGDAETRGEFVIVIAPPDENALAPSAEDVDGLLRRTLSETTLKDAVAIVADATGQPRREIYQRALALVKSDGAAD